MARLCNGLELPEGVVVDLSPEARARAMEEARARNDALVEQATRRWEQARAGVGDPSRLAPDAQKRAVSLVASLQAEGAPNAWICGRTGSGKSELAKAIVAAWNETGPGDAVLVPVRQVLDGVRSCFGGRGDAARELDRWKRRRLLVLEQLEQVSAQDWELQALHELADWRLEHRLPTVVVCKLDPMAWYAQAAVSTSLAMTAEGIVSRLAGRCEVVVLEPPGGRDRRLEKGARR